MIIINKRNLVKKSKILIENINRKYKNLTQKEKMNLLTKRSRSFSIHRLNDSKKSLLFDDQDKKFHVSSYVRLIKILVLSKKF